MSSVALRAHFNGTQIILDEPFELTPEAKLLIIVLPTDVERDEWLEFSGSHLNAAYENDEPEYTIDDLIEINPTYEPR